MNSPEFDLTSEAWLQPRFGRKPTFEEALQRPVRWRRIRRFLRAVIYFLTFVVIVLLTLDNSESSTVGFRQSDLADKAGPLAIGGLLVVALFGWYALWRSPDRILLLRPFGRKKLSKAVRRFSKRNLAVRGFTVSLADRYLRESIFLWIVSSIPTDPGELLIYFYRPLYRRVRRFLIIRKPRDLRELNDRIGGRFSRGRFCASTLGLSDGIQKVRTLDPVWRSAVDLLMSNSQVIVMDLSEAKEGSRWELQRIRERGLEWKTLLIAEQNSVEQAKDEIGRSWGSGWVVHLYRSNDGTLLDAVAFGNEYARLVSDMRQPVAPTRRVPRKALAALGMTLIPISNFSTAPLGIILGLWALADIRKNPGRLRGAMLAHFLIFANILLACFSLLIGMIFSF